MAHATTFPASVLPASDEPGLRTRNPGSNSAQADSDSPGSFPPGKHTRQCGQDYAGH